MTDPEPAHSPAMPLAISTSPAALAPARAPAMAPASQPDRDEADAPDSPRSAFSIASDTGAFRRAAGPYGAGSGTGSGSDTDEDNDDENAPPPPFPDLPPRTSSSSLAPATGFGGKGLMLRRRKVIRPAVEGITKGDIKRLARRGGIKRMNCDIYTDVRDGLRGFLTEVIGDAVCLTQHRRRKTVSTEDVIHALKRRGKTLYGYN